ncbi:MAG: long-chain fatty acid--CoA ligase [Flavobacteriales bacterium]
MQVTRIFDIPRYQLREKPLSDALVTKGIGGWEKTSTREYLNQADRLSRGLLRIGLKPRDKVAIISSTNRTEWSILDIGILQIGAVNVPVYPTISQSDYKYVFTHAEVRYCFVSDGELYAKIQSIQKEIPTLKAVYSLDPVTGVKNWREILALGADDSNQKEVDARMQKTRPEDLATLIYTSGTTGKPKGVMLSHRNIVCNILGVQPRVPNIGISRALSFLPLSHIFERIILYLYQIQGISIYFAENTDSIGDNLKEVKPNIISVVPRLLEKVYDRITARGSALKGLKSTLFFWALDLGKQYEPFKNNGFWYNCKLRIARRLVFSKWREALGGNLLAVVSGSAALQPRLIRVFGAAGIPVLEGYGTTETAPVISVNTRAKALYRLGTVGKPIDNVRVVIAEDGEILAKGPNVMLGYYRDAEKTKNAIDEGGYYHTGDIGRLEDGFLRITGRKKEMFKTSGGKYITPQAIETLMRQSRFIEQIMVVGEGEKMPAALIQPDFEFVGKWARHEGIELGKTRRDQVENQVLKSRIAVEVDKYNRELGGWERLKDFALIPDVWSVEGQQLTPTLKLKRREILRQYQSAYDKIYRK